MRFAALSLLLALPLAIPAFAQTATAPAPQKAMTSPQQKGPRPPMPAALPQMTPAQHCARIRDNRIKRLDQVAVALKLTPAQKPAFEAWRKARIEAGDAMPCPPPPMGMGQPAPFRIKNQIIMATANLAALKKIQKSTEDFYKVLTEDQRETFNMPMRTMMKVTVPPDGPKNGRITVTPADPGDDEPTKP